MQDFSTSKINSYFQADNLKMVTWTCLNFIVLFKEWDEAFNLFFQQLYCVLDTTEKPGVYYQGSFLTLVTGNSTKQKSVFSKFVQGASWEAWRLPNPSLGYGGLVIEESWKKWSLSWILKDVEKIGSEQPKSVTLYG